MERDVSTLTPEERRALSVQELIGRADLLNAAGRVAEMVALYREWLEGNVGHPFAHYIQYNYGVVLSNLPDLPASAAAFREAIRLQPDFFPPYINLGNVMERQGAPVEAAEVWRGIVNRLPMVNAEAIGYKLSALKQIGRVSGMAEAEEVLRQSLEIHPQQHEIMEHWINWRQLQCKWPVMVPFGACDKAHLMKGFAPLSLAVYTDDPMLQLANAAMYHDSEVGQPTPTFLEEHARLKNSPGTRIRVGYLSSDLRIHAIGFLMAELFECHDQRERVELFVYSIGQQFEDPIRQRIRAVVDGEHWRDLSVLSDADAARRIVADGIEILVDINGYTHSARTKMLAMRPAPVIVNWLGYPGTMGSPYHHYLIADPFIIPPEHEIFYSERVVRLPCYQPNDRKRYVSPHRPTRQEAGLPESGVVFGCFNGVKKITAFTWRLWTRILQQVPGSVLWLLHESDLARARLTDLAVENGIAPERVIFAPRMVNHDHMARYPLVDLMLDSSPYGAHTTASDALWMGVPILTMAGLSFPARVCGSLVSAAGLPEMVCATPEAYVERAVALGSHPEMLLELRRRLLEGRDQCVLFDTPKLADHLEGLYARMRADFLQDALPRPDLSNLALYQEVGIELDDEGVWFLSVARLEATYLEKLGQRDRLRFIPPDGRLWSQAARRRHAGRALQLFEEVSRLEAAGDLAGLLQLVQNRTHDPREMRLAAVESLARGRIRPAYILAMLLANVGWRDPVLGVALGVGGLVFSNPAEEARGLAMLDGGEMPTLDPGERAGELARSVGPARAQLEALVRKGVEPERAGALLTRLRSLDSRAFGEAPGAKDSFEALSRAIAPIKVVDIGAGVLPGFPLFYQPLLAFGVEVTGFEPNASELAILDAQKQPWERYLPHAVGDGGRHRLHYCRIPGMSSLLPPNPEVLELFHGFPVWGEVTGSGEIDTVRLDDLPEIVGVEFLKLDIQGAELMVLQHAEARLREALVLQIEVEFLPMYRDQPLFAEVERFLRGRGFLFHRFCHAVSRVLQPMPTRDPYAGMSQLFWADAVFVRDFTHLERFSERQLAVMATIVHHCYGSRDLAYRLLAEYDRRTLGRVADAFLAGEGAR